MLTQKNPLGEHSRRREAVPAEPLAVATWAGILASDGGGLQVVLMTLLHTGPPTDTPSPPPTLTNVLLRCRVSVRTTSVSQFLTLRKRGHLEGLPFLVGDCFPEVGGCE